MTMENTIQFIEVVKRHEAIYDTTHKDYKNMERKANAWRDVAQEVGLTVEACKRKWKNLRDSYTKYLRSFRTGTKTSRKYQYWAHAGHMEFLRPFQGPGRSQVFKMEDPYDKFEHMEFLRPFQNSGRVPFKVDEPYEERFNGTNFKQESLCDFGFEVLDKCSPDDDIDILDPTLDQDKADTPSIYMNSINKSKTMIKMKDLDATSMFFLSLAKSVRNMPIKYRNQVKMRCMRIVSEAEIEIEHTAMDIDSNMSGSNGALSPSNNDISPNHQGESNEVFHQEQETEVKDGVRHENDGHQSVSQAKQILEEHSKAQLQLDIEKENQQHQQQQGDNSEHFLYVMSPSKVEGLIDISSEDEN